MTVYAAPITSAPPLRAADTDQARRKTLERKWGFGGLLDHLSRRDGASFEVLGGLAWSYALMSHLQHADYLGVMVPMERAARSVERHDTMHLSHLARLLIDALQFMLNRLSVGYRFVGADLAPIMEAQKKTEALKSSFGGAYERWLDLEYGRAT